MWIWLSAHINHFGAFKHTIEPSRNEHFIKCAECWRFNEFMSWLLILKWDWCENLHLEMKAQHNFLFLVVPVFLLIFIFISECEESGKEIVCSTATCFAFAFVSISLNTLLWIVFAAGISTSTRNNLVYCKFYTNISSCACIFIITSLNDLDAAIIFFF